VHWMEIRRLATWGAVLSVIGAVLLGLEVLSRFSGHLSDGDVLLSVIGMAVAATGVGFSTYARYSRRVDE